MGTARGDRPEIGRTGARFGRHDATRVEPAPVAGGPPEPVHFATVVRGYERADVDRFVARQERLVEELRASLASAEARLADAVARAGADAAEIDRLRARLAADPESTTGYGARAEKLLRLAESEATAIRAEASQESTATLERARAAAEQHRHESEQAVIARLQEVDADARRRLAELAEREQQSVRKGEAERAESERTCSAAVEAAGRLRDEARAEAELVTARARAEAGRINEQVRVELGRVAGLRADVHGELERIHRLILGQLAPPGRPDTARRRGAQERVRT